MIDNPRRINAKSIYWFVWNFGPIVITALTPLWGVASYPFARSGDNWATVPLIVLAFIVVLWHAISIIIGPDRWIKVIVAIFNIPICGIMVGFLVAVLSKNSM